MAMRVLGIESSCDETGVALFDTGQGLLAHALHSQIDLHAAYGGVVPELASRDHVRKTLPLVRAVLDEAGSKASDINGVAYTAGPGLALGQQLIAAIHRQHCLARKQGQDPDIWVGLGRTHRRRQQPGCSQAAANL